MSKVPKSKPNKKINFKTGPWTPEEDQLLSNMMTTNPTTSFNIISDALNNSRSPTQCHYRWKVLSTQSKFKSSSSTPSISTASPSPSLTSETSLSFSPFSEIKSIEDSVSYNEEKKKKKEKRRR